MNTPTQRPEHKTAGSGLNVFLWIVFAVALALNAGLSIAGYFLLSVAFGIVALTFGIVLVVRYLNRRAS